MWLSSSSTTCTICGDPKARSHYGVIACDGCKAFFRRSVRLGLTYHCVHGGSCDISRNKRNICRSCRFNRCLRAGMTEQAVEHERDKIASTRGSASVQHSSKRRAAAGASSPTPPLQIKKYFLTGASTADISIFRKLIANDITIYGLQTQEFAAYVSAHFRSFLQGLFQNHLFFTDEILKYKSSANKPAMAIAQGGESYQLCTANDVYKLMKPPLQEFIKLMMCHEGFKKIPLTDKVALFRSHAPECVLFTDAIRSVPFRDFILLSDKQHMLPRGFSNVPGISNLVNRVLDDLIEPLRSLDVDPTEMCCMKALAFWNPDVCSEESKGIAKKKRLMYLIGLEKYVHERQNSNSSPARFGSLLMLQRTLQDVGQKLREVIQLCQLLGLTSPDSLIEDCFKENGSVAGPLCDLLNTQATNGADLLVADQSDIVDSPLVNDRSIIRQFSEDYYSYKDTNDPNPRSSVTAAVITELKPNQYHHQNQSISQSSDNNNQYANQSDNQHPNKSDNHYHHLTTAGYNGVTLPTMNAWPEQPQQPCGYTNCQAPAGHPPASG